MELSTSLQAMEPTLNLGAQGNEGSPKHRMETVVEPQDLNNEVAVDQLNRPFRG